MPELIEIPDPNVYLAYGVYFLKSNHKFVQRLRRNNHLPEAHGYRTWQSSFLLIDYLEHHPPKRKSNVMDIGCGWAPVGVFCARRFQAKVTGVDIDEHVFPYMELLAALNDVKVSRLKTTFDKLTTNRLSAENLIVGSDICFWDEMVKPLYNLINRALKAGVPRIVLSDPGRPTFFDLASKCESKWGSELIRWYALEPKRHNGEILEIVNPK